MARLESWLRANSTRKEAVLVGSARLRANWRELNSLRKAVLRVSHDPRYYDSLIFFSQEHVLQMSLNSCLCCRCP